MFSLHLSMNVISLIGDVESAEGRRSVVVTGEEVVVATIASTNVSEFGCLIAVFLSLVDGVTSCERCFRFGVSICLLIDRFGVVVEQEVVLKTDSTNLAS